MDLEIHADDTGFFIRLPSRSQVLYWHRQGDRWVSGPKPLPARCSRVDFSDLPTDLREEVLASAARADAMDNRLE